VKEDIKLGCRKNSSWYCYEN